MNLISKHLIAAFKKSSKNLWHQVSSTERMSEPEQAVCSAQRRNKATNWLTKHNQLLLIETITRKI